MVSGQSSPTRSGSASFVSGGVDFCFGFVIALPPNAILMGASPIQTAGIELSCISWDLIGVAGDRRSAPGSLPLPRERYWVCYRDLGALLGALLGSQGFGLRAA